AESEDRELNCLGHGRAQPLASFSGRARPPSGRTRSTSCHLMYWVTSIGCLAVTTFFPLNRETYTKWFELDLNTLKPGVEGLHGGVRPSRSTFCAVFNAWITDAGVKESTLFVTLTNASVEIHGAKSGVFSLATVRLLFFDAFMSAKYCLSPGKFFTFAWAGYGNESERTVPFVIEGYFRSVSSVKEPGFPPSGIFALSCAMEA